MSTPVFTRRLRPHLFSAFTRSQCLHPTPASHRQRHDAVKKDRDVTHDYEKRVAQLRAASDLSACYPRLSPTVSLTRPSKSQLEDDYSYIDPGKTDLDKEMALTGMDCGGEQTKDETDAVSRPDTLGTYCGQQIAVRGYSASRRVRASRMQAWETARDSIQRHTG